MASVNFMKLKSAGEVKAMLRHSDTEERLKHDHSNRDINIELTKNNVNYTTSNYEKSCKRFDERIKLLDSTTNTNKRKDRVLAFALEVPAPEKMDAKMSKKFFSDVLHIMNEQYGMQNMLGAYAHYDEIHVYFDHGELKESRPHLHCFFVAEHNGQLNGKWFSSRKNMIELNKAIDHMCREKYDMRFMTNEEPRHRTVEELKAHSEMVLNEREDIIREVNAVIEENQHLVKSLEAVSKYAEKTNDLILMQFADRAVKRAYEIEQNRPKPMRETTSISHDDYER